MFREAVKLVFSFMCRQLIFFTQSGKLLSTELLFFTRFQPTKKPCLSQRNDKTIKFLISLFQQTLCTIVLDCCLFFFALKKCVWLSFFLVCKTTADMLTEMHVCFHAFADGYSCTWKGEKTQTSELLFYMP